ncbi:hypothetical protein EDD22DRAFT_972456 [Suillus occidentalis]|nr:hypothetical protein EDD22DRAFT_972456 [Suillus occidentalis]
MLSRPHISGLSPIYNAQWSDDDDEYTVIPAGYRLPTSINPIHQNWLDLNEYQNTLLEYYMKRVLPIQFSHADGSVDAVVWTLIHSSDAAREAAYLLADLHRRSTQGGSIGYTKGNGKHSSTVLADFPSPFLKRSPHSPASALISCTDSMRFIVKTSMWYDVLASVTLIRRPMFEVLRILYDPLGTALINGRPEVSMMGVMGCENRIVLALAETY